MVLVIFAWAAAFRIIRNTALVVIGLSAPYPGKSQCFGRTAFQYCRSVSSSTGLEHHIPILLAFALLNMDDHAAAIDIGKDETACFGNAQAGSICTGTPANRNRGCSGDGAKD